jgi:type IV secretory pathway VirB10-like protein
MELPKEPDPKPIPVATGAVPVSMQKWIGVIVLGCIFFFMVIGWAISRWSGPSKGLMGQRQEKVVSPESHKGDYQLNEKLEAAYDKGKKEGADKARQTINTPPTPSYVPPAAQLTPRQQATQDYEKLLHDAAMTDNMVSSRKEESNDARRTALGGLRDASLGGPLDPQTLATMADGNRQPITPVVDRGTKLPQAAPIGANVLPEGTIIYCVLVNQLNGDNTGPVTVQVSNDVLYPGTTDVAIPQGSLFLGEAQKLSAQFQQRLAVSFHRLQIGTTAGQIRQIDLKAPALDQQGAAALSDKVNNHYASIFGASLAVGAIGGLSQIGSGSYGGYGGIDAGTQVRNGISQSTAQSASQILNRFLNRLPTVTIRPGTAAVVYLTGNLDLSVSQ